MYESEFGFSRRPFATVPDPDFFFATPAHQEVLDELLVTLCRGTGIGVLTGPAGVGKTLFCRKIGRELALKFRVVQLAGSHLKTRRGMLQAVLHDLDQPYSELNEEELRLSLNDAIGELDEEALVVIVDEADLLGERMLEELRTLADLSEGNTGRVRVLLVGDVSLEERLAEPSLKALNQRIAAQAVLQSMSQRESEEYIRHRISVAGSTLDSVLTADAVNLITELSDGYSRQLNQLCDHTLLLAYAGEQQPADRNLVLDAFRDLQHLPLRWNLPLHDEEFSDSEDNLWEAGTPDEAFMQEANEHDVTEVNRENMDSEEDVVGRNSYETVAKAWESSQEFAEAQVDDEEALTDDETPSAVEDCVEEDANPGAMVSPLPDDTSTEASSIETGSFEVGGEETVTGEDAESNETQQMPESKAAAAQVVHDEFDEQATDNTEAPKTSIPASGPESEGHQAPAESETTGKAGVYELPARVGPLDDMDCEGFEDSASDYELPTVEQSALVAPDNEVQPKQSAETMPAPAPYDQQQGSSINDESVAEDVSPILNTPSDTKSSREFEEEYVVDRYATIDAGRSFPPANIENSLPPEHGSADEPPIPSDASNTTAAARGIDAEIEEARQKLHDVASSEISARERASYILDEILPRIEGLDATWDTENPVAASEPTADAACREQENHDDTSFVSQDSEIERTVSATGFSDTENVGTEGGHKFDSEGYEDEQLSTSDMEDDEFFMESLVHHAYDFDLIEPEDDEGDLSHAHAENVCETDETTEASNEVPLEAQQQHRDAGPEKTRSDAVEPTLYPETGDIQASGERRFDIDSHKDNRRPYRKLFSVLRRRQAETYKD